MTTLIRADVQAAFDAALPGVDFDLYMNKDAWAAIDWAPMDTLLRQVTFPPYGYDIAKWNCADNSRWVITQVKILWAQQNPNAPALCCGVIEGDVPLDGDNGNIGWHSLGWFIDTQKKFWLIGCYDREAMSQDVLGEVKTVEYAGTGG